MMSQSHTENALYSPSLRQSLIKIPILPQKAKQVIEGMSVYHQNKNLFFLYLTFVILFYLSMVLSFRLMFAMFNTEISILTLVTIIMLTRIIAMIPVSLNGYGLLDGSFVYLISQTGISYEIAVLVMMLRRILGTGVSLFGGLVYLCDHTA